VQSQVCRSQDEVLSTAEQRKAATLEGLERADGYRRRTV
jgi:hypothetical protein